MIFAIETHAQQSDSIPCVIQFAILEKPIIQKELEGFGGEWKIESENRIVFSSTTESKLEQNLIKFFRRKGYLSCSIDINFERNNDYFDKGNLTNSSKKLHLGPIFRWLNISPKGDIERSWLRSADIQFDKWNDEPISIEGLIIAENRLIEQAENRGYPFAKVYVDSLREEKKGIFTCQFVLEKGPYFSFESLDIESPIKIPKRYLGSILGIQEGEMFSRRRILEIEKRLTALPFLSLKESPKVRFGVETAQVRLIFEEKKANRFDFLIGLLPQGGASNRTILTGSLDGLFYNALNQGERFEIKLERLRPETQRADINMDVPHILRLPFGATTSLHLHKRDSSFLDANSRLGLSYLFENGDQIQVFWENKSSSLLTVDTLKIIQNERLPQALDFRRNGLGMLWRHSSLDYLLNPRSGFAINFRFSVGLNRILRNAQIENISTANVDFRSLYEEQNLAATRFQSDQSIEFYQPILKRSTLKLALNANGLFSNSSIFRNEQYRLGGTNSIRGFDEESLFTTRSAYTTVEYRLLLSRDAHLSAFSDYGYFKNLTEEVSIKQWLLSCGVGMALQTGTGQFNISVAVGRSGKDSFDLRASKFHLGFLSYF